MTWAREMQRRMQRVSQGVNLVEGKKNYISLSISICQYIYICIYLSMADNDKSFKSDSDRAFGSSKEETDGGFYSGSDGGKTEAESQR